MLALLDESRQDDGEVLQAANGNQCDGDELGESSAESARW
jgi:hypothetical protein